MYVCNTIYSSMYVTIHLVAVALSVDDITIPSVRGNGVLRRVTEVFDCWFESGRYNTLYGSVHPNEFISLMLRQLLSLSVCPMLRVTTHLRTRGHLRQRFQLILLPRVSTKPEDGKGLYECAKLISLYLKSISRAIDISSQSVIQAKISQLN